MTCAELMAARVCSTSGVTPEPAPCISGPMMKNPPTSAIASTASMPTKTNT
jgi:hypothetical protein